MVWLVIGQDLWAIFVFALHDVSHHLQYRLWTVTLREGLKTNWLVLGLFFLNGGPHPPSIAMVMTQF